MEFKEALCDSGSSVNLVSKAIVDEQGIVDVEPSQVKLTFANSSMAVPYGTIRNLPVFRLRTVCSIPNFRLLR